MGVRSTMPDLRRVLRVVLIGRRQGTRRRLFRRLVGCVRRDRSSDPEPVTVMSPVSAPPEGFVLLTTVDELPEGTIGEFFVGDQAVALAHVEGEFYALDNTCPHAGGPLGDGMLTDGVVACPWHGWEFDVRTGTCQLDPSLAVACVAVEVRGTDVFVRLPEPSS